MCHHAWVQFIQFSQIIHVRCDRHRLGVNVGHQQLVFGSIRADNAPNCVIVAIGDLLHETKVTPAGVALTIGNDDIVIAICLGDCHVTHHKIMCPMLMIDVKR